MEEEKTKYDFDLFVIGSKTLLLLLNFETKKVEVRAVSLAHAKLSNLAHV